MLAAVLFTLSISPAKAQQLPHLPGDTELRVTEDYAKYEQLVTEVADWLEETDLDKQTELRREAGRFIFIWVSGSPTVNVPMSDYFFKLVDNNPNLTTIYMARYASYCLVNKSYQDRISPARAGLIAISRVYQKGIRVTKNKAMNKLQKVIDQNKLDDYIRKNIWLTVY
ncbi:hypothetical protein [Chitinophaga sp.]|uniref:hypothetical protein n=1 Tax=Chitinophaga sp. TaxID=1869181 RepID=UPI0025BC6EED|nr:hypothetical protein [Chitinophaga sp.]